MATNEWAVEVPEGAEPAVEVVTSAIEALPHHVRLYPDLYATRVVAALATAGALA